MQCITVNISNYNMARGERARSASGLMQNLTLLLRIKSEIAVIARGMGGFENDSQLDMP